MENNLILISLAVCGLFLRLVHSIMVRSDKDSSFSLRIYISNYKNWLRMILSIISVFILFLIKDDLKSLVRLTVPDYHIGIKALSVAIGYFNYSIVSSLLSLASKFIPKNNEESN